MKCRSVQKKLSAYQDGELKPLEQEELNRHLLSCRSCREAYEQLERVWRTLGGLEEIRPDPWFYGQLVRRIKEQREHGLLPALQHVFQVIGAPAIASIILVIGLVAGSSTTRSGPTAASMPAPAPEAVLPLSFQSPQLIRNSSEWGSTLT